MKRRVGIILGILILIGAALLYFVLGRDSKEVRAQNHFEFGQELLASQEPVKAVLEFRNAIKLQEDFILARYALAGIYEEHGNLLGAVANYKIIAEFDKSHLDARIRLTRIMLLAGQFDQALEYSNSAYLIDDNNAEVLALRASVVLNLDNKVLAVKLARKALQIDPQNVDAHAVLVAERFSAGSTDEALRLLDAGLEVNKNNVPLLMLQLMIFEQLGNNEKVGDVLKQLTNMHPNTISYRQALAKWYLKVGDTVAAEKELRSISAEHPDNLEVALDVIRFLDKTEGSEAAREELLKRIKNNIENIDYKLALAQLYSRDGNTEDALQLLKDTISSEVDPVYGNRAKIQLALLYLSRSNQEAAEDLVGQILTDDENNIDALSLRASISMKKGDIDDAIQDLRTALNENPISSNLMLLLAEAHELNGSTELAEDRLAAATRASNFNPSVTQKYVQFLLRNGNENAAGRVLEKIILRFPQNRYALTELAQVRLRNQDWIGAQQVADSLRQLDDQSVAVDRITAAALSGQGRYNESIQILKDVVSKSQSLIFPMAELIQTFLRANEYDKAEVYLLDVISENPKNSQALVLLGSLYTASNKLKEAEQSFKAAIEIESGETAAYLALSRYYFTLGRNDDAISVIQQGLSFQGQNSSLLLTLAALMEKKGEYEAAIVQYEKIFSQQPGSAVVANNLASLLSEYRSDQSSLDRAYSIARRFRSSDIPQFQDTLGWIQHLRGENRQAVILLKSAAEQMSDNPWVQYHLGMSYIELGQNEQAAIYLGKAVELSGSSNFSRLKETNNALKNLKNK